MSKTAQKLQEWMASRKFALLIAYWAFIFIGAAIIYIFNTETFDNVLEVYNSALEWALWGLITFSSIEGGKELTGMIRGKKPVTVEYDQTKTEVA